MSRLFLCLLLLHIFSLAVAFKVVKFSQVPDRQDLTVGERLILLCKSNNAWERCNFVHRPTGGSNLPTGDQFCKQEWKRSSSSVQLQECSIKGRVKMHGSYARKECGIEIASLQLRDSGTWECEMEEYVTGDLWSGPSHKHHFAPITVREKPVITTSTTTTSTTLAPSTTAEEVVVPEISDEDVKDTEEPDYYPSPDSMEVEEDYQEETNSTMEGPVEEAVVWHINEEEGEEAASTVGPIVGGVVAAMVLVGAILAAAFLWNRRRKTLTVITMSKLLKEAEESVSGADERTQSSSFLEEAEYNTPVPGGV